MARPARLALLVGTLTAVGGVLLWAMITWLGAIDLGHGWADSPP